MRKFQWEDWTDLKFKELESEEYRRAVDRMAHRLVEANAAAEKASLSGATIEIAAMDASDELGALDKLGVMEGAIPSMADTLTEVGALIEEIGALMQGATLEVQNADHQSSPLAARLTIARKLASTLSGPSDRLRDLGNEFATSLNDVDAGVRIIIGRAPEEVAENPEARQAFVDFFGSIRQMVSQAGIALGAVKSMIDSLAPVERMSRDLRPPLRTLREGLTLFVDGFSVMEGWLKEIDQAEAALRFG